MKKKIKKASEEKHLMSLMSQIKKKIVIFLMCQTSIEIILIL